jgi:hypothetical protein
MTGLAGMTGLTNITGMAGEMAKVLEGTRGHTGMTGLAGMTGMAGMAGMAGEMVGTIGAIDVGIVGYSADAAIQSLDGGLTEQQVLYLRVYAAILLSCGGVHLLLAHPTAAAIALAAASIMQLAWLASAGARLLD